MLKLNRSSGTIFWGFLLSFPAVESSEHSRSEGTRFLRRFKDNGRRLICSEFLPATSLGSSSLIVVTVGSKVVLAVAAVQSMHGHHPGSPKQNFLLSGVAK